MGFQGMVMKGGSAVAMQGSWAEFNTTTYSADCSIWQ
jgi:hypothetical protein